ncbi:EAL domain-containing protein (putative c-di-GMP-specific phosphodiesterase class I) [Kineococcus xinjiangensis]|uniref:EAL domain-containing protein (Putative c-di-GMP-specific phosphodiesterase class I) n=1 Tax=Kineococcus xinjiangensis TaxID=512762 RepID=A0A2S6IFZ3_9ACTN|nr:EAL domain-containing protein [Kineococcus xinjiangensis]PPK93106.1 EAL domain-containing protein (putative c-di-GMP-specific phosphodiesterase class I) [Kineococcus xinjiangensis]
MDHAGAVPLPVVTGTPAAPLLHTAAAVRRATALQPIVELSTGRVVGLEALSRFSTAGGEPLRPERVFAEAHRRGGGAELEHLALTAALALLPCVPAGRYLSVNASPTVLLHPRTVPLLLAAEPQRLVVEVTEHEPVQDYRALRAALDVLRGHGARIAVDDAGSGYASLQHVLHLAPEVVKLDIAFVAGIDTDPARRAVTRALVGLAAEVGATLVAEGVERAAELAVLLDLGVACGQGHHLGRPLVAAPPARSDGGTAAAPADDDGPAPLWGCRAVGDLPVEDPVLGR